MTSHIQVMLKLARGETHEIPLNSISCMCEMTSSIMTKSYDEIINARTKSFRLIDQEKYNRKKPSIFLFKGQKQHPKTYHIRI